MATIIAFLFALGFLQGTAAKYDLVDNHEGESFFSKFDFFTDPDPTHGFVRYVGEEEARRSGLIDVRTGYGGKKVVWMGADYTNVTPKGRPSVRIEGQNNYNQGLWIADFAHVPGTTCAIWPAYWLLGPDWPSSGEIDIYEGVNLDTSNSMTLHAGNNCSISRDAPFTGRLTAPHCDIHAPSPHGNGCQIAADDITSFGTVMNLVGGGVYATEWTTEDIKIWFFPRHFGIPEDILAGQPDPDSWGRPVALFSGNCTFNESFKNMRIVFDITFCGDWAGNPKVWSDSPCSAITSKCEQFVEQFPTAFMESYWAINYVKVYQRKGGDM